MKPRQADSLIKSGKPVTLYDSLFDQTMTVVIVSRDRWNIRTACGMKLDRGDMQIVVPE